MFLLIAAAFVVVGAFMAFVLIAVVVLDRRERERRRQLQADLPNILPGWTEERLTTQFTPLILDVQQAWGSGDLEGLERTLTLGLFERMRRQLDVMAKIGRRARWSGASLTSLDVIRATKPDATSPAGFEAELKIGGTMLIETADGTVLHEEDKPPLERWSFVEVASGGWRVSGIDRPHREGWRTAEAAAFGSQLDFDHDPGFGWVVLPQHGVTFADASFDDSRIKGHLLGDRRGRPVQVYSYVADPRVDRPIEFLVAETTIQPVHGILVRARSSQFLRRTPVGMHEIELQDETFTDRLEVFCDPRDDPSAFALLRPSYLRLFAGQDFFGGFEAVGPRLFVFDGSYAADRSVLLGLVDAALDELEGVHAAP